MNETLPFDDTNDSEVSETIQESGDDSNRPEDVSPGAPYTVVAVLNLSL